MLQRAISILKRTMKMFDEPFEHHYPIIVNSVPKSGTNLLKNITLNIPGTLGRGDFSLAITLADASEQLGYVKQRVQSMSAGSVYTGHVPFSSVYSEWLKANRIKQLFIYRDPRDYTVSLYHYIMKDIMPRHAYYDLFDSLKNDHERLMAAIKGVGIPDKKLNSSPEFVKGVKWYFDSNFGWLSNSNTFCLKYEDLLNQQRAILVMRELLMFLDFKKPSQLKQIPGILKRGFNPSKSHTYRKGEAGAWKKEYTAEHIAVFKEVTGDIIEKYGYSW